MARPLTRLISMSAAALLVAAATGAPAGASAPDDTSTEDTSAEDTSTGDTSTGDTSAAADAFPVTIEHIYGETVIDEEPTRIVTLGLSDQDAFLALGVAPIAVSEWYGGYDHAVWPWAQDELGDAEPIVLNGGERDEANPPFEEIAALDPDVIVSLYNALTEGQYEQLSEIAPVVMPTEEFANFAMTWQEGTRVTGEVLGREDEALELVADLEERFEEEAAAHPEFAGQLAIVAERFQPGESIVRSGSDVRARFFELLGFDTPTEVGGQLPDEFGEIAVSVELMAELSADLLVWNIGDDSSLRGVIEELPLYDALPVVEAGHVLWIEDPEISGAFTWGTVLSLDFALDELVPQIAETVG